jgi:methylmalonyl-CoA mutase
MSIPEEKIPSELPEVDFSEFTPPDYETWKAEATAVLKGASFEKKLFTKTYEEITLKPIYRMEDAPDPAILANLPGMENYMRGTHIGGYVTNPWKITQRNAALLPKELNAIIRQSIEKGATAVQIELDWATKHGQDVEALEDEAIEKGEASISTLQDLQEILQGVDIKKNPIFIPTGAENAALLGLFAALQKANGENTEHISGLIGADPLGTLASEAMLPMDIGALYDELAQSTLWAEMHMKDMATILIDGAPYNDGGASATQELGYMMATAIAYIRELGLRGVSAEIAARHMHFSFSLGSNFFMEIAKLRAAKMIWAQIVESFGGSKEAQKMKSHAKNSRFNKTTYDPYVNMLRTTTEAFSAVIGGVDSLETSPFDVNIQPSDDFSRRIARNTQLILQGECNLCSPADPVGGSWYVESLTQEVAEKAWGILQEIEGAGGMFAALENGMAQSAVQKVLEQRFKKLAQRADRVVGVNMYANMLEKPQPIRKIDVAAIRAQRLTEIKNYTDDVDSEQRDILLRKIAPSLNGKRIGLIEALQEAFLSGSTLGEAVIALHQGQNDLYIDKKIEKHFVAEQFEQLRNHMNFYEKKNGEKAKIFLCNMGKIPQHKARADFSTGFLEVGGFEIIKNNGFLNPADAVEAAVASGAFAAVICSTDATYPELVPVVAAEIKEKCPAMTVLLAGAADPELEVVYRKAGVDDFIHVRANCLELLTWLQQKGGVQ